MMSKYGEAWQNYYKAVSRLGAVSVFPDPDISPDKSFATSGEWERWYKAEQPTKKKLVRKPKKQIKTVRTKATETGLEEAGVSEETLKRLRGLR
jgi:hypothetical protein